MAKGFGYGGERNVLQVVKRLSRTADRGCIATGRRLDSSEAVSRVSCVRRHRRVRAQLGFAHLGVPDLTVGHAR